MQKVEINQLDLKNYNDGKYNIIVDVLQQMQKDYLCYSFENDIEVNDNIKITHFRDFNDYEVSINFDIEEQLLLTFITDLDARCYDSITVLYNDVVLNESDMKYANHTTYESEQLEYLLYDIETELMNMNDVTKEYPNIDIDMYIDELDFKDKLDVELLRIKIYNGIDKLFDYLNDCVNEFLCSDDFNEFLFEIEMYNLECLDEELKDNGGKIEVYI